MDAAEIHLEEGRTMKAIQLFLMDRNNATSMRRGYECIVQQLWRHLAFGISRKSASENPIVLELLEFGKQLNVGLLDSSATDEVCP